VAAGGAEARLRRLIPSVPTRLLFVDHVQARGRDFFEVACAPDLEGIVGKLASGRYHADGTSTNRFAQASSVAARAASLRRAVRRHKIQVASLNASDYRGFNTEGQLLKTVNRVACWPSGVTTRNRWPSAVTSY
jgi:hypothetical protein